MKISTKQFNLYNSIIRKAKNNESTSRANMLIDPNKGFCSCTGEDFNFRFNFDIVEKNKEDLSLFRVDIERLLAISEIYSELIIDENYIFYGDSDKFKLYVEKNDIKDLGFSFDYKNEDNKVFDLKEQDFQSIGKALQFVGEPKYYGDKNMNVIRISKGKLISSNGSCIYQNSLSHEVDFTIDISDNVSYILFDLFGKGFNELSIYFNEKNNGFVICDSNKNFEIISEPVSDVYLPDDKKLLELEESINKAGDLTLEIERLPFKDIIDFFGIFVSDSINEPIVISCYKNKLEIEGTDNSDNSSGKRSFNKISYISKDMQNFTFIFPRRNINQTLNAFVLENIKIQIGMDKNGKYHFARIQEIDGNKNEKISTVLLSS